MLRQTYGRSMSFPWPLSNPIEWKRVLADFYRMAGAAGSTEHAADG
jgi:hypothetical protein